MNIFVLLILFCFAISSSLAIADENGGSSYSKPSNGNNRTIVDAKGAPQSVIWVVQLSDLHFSVHHPDRALHFRDLVAPALAMINPSLVLITGDLTGSALPVFGFYIYSFHSCSFKCAMDINL